MAGNRAIYTRAMEQHREAARANKWDEALKNAARAMQEFPQDTDARVAVAVALFHSNRLPQALQMFSELRAADPQNELFIGYIARTQEKQGDRDTAIQTYRTLLSLYQGKGAVAQVIDTLRAILKLRPELDADREQLAQALLDARQPQNALPELVTLAQRYQAQGRLEQAVTYAERALKLDPNNRDLKELLIQLREAQAAGTDAPATGGGAPASATAERGSGGGLAANVRENQFALEQLLAEAQELQEAEQYQDAVARYEQVLAAGLERSDVLYSLGLLYQQVGDHPAAIPILARAARDPEYGLSAHYALGTSYSEMGQPQKAAQEFEQAIGMVDLETVGKAEAEDLIQMYEQVTGIYQQMGDLARAASLYSTLASFLESKRWGRERAAAFKKKAKDLTDQTMLAKLRALGTGVLSMVTDPDPEPLHSSASPGDTTPSEEIAERWGTIAPMIEMLRSDNVEVSPTSLLSSISELPPSSISTDPIDVLDTLPPAEDAPPVTIIKLDPTGLDEQTERWVVLSERYMEQNLLDAALDACYEVIRLNMDYLPIHLRLGQIYEMRNQPEEALAKYQTLIDTYNVRNEPEKAIDVYMRYIELAPEATNARARLAELLKNVGRTDEAAEQIAYVASGYFRIGQTNRALEEYRRGLQIAPHNRTLRSEYGMALFKLERYEAALNEFHKAADAEDPIAIAHINMVLVVLAESPDDIWDSLAALLELLERDAYRASDAVQSEYRAALMVNDSPLLHYVLAMIQRKANQHSSALLELEQALVLISSEPHALLPPVLVRQAMASSYLALGQHSQALSQLSAIQREGGVTAAASQARHSFARPLDQGELVQQMADAYAESDDLEGAERALREALKLLPYNRAIYTKLADVCFRQGKLGEALSSLENLATYYEDRQELDAAIETLQYALKLAPSSIPVGLRLARMYIRRGYPEQGVEGLKTVAELQRREGLIKDAVASLHQAAEVRYMLGQHADTLALYDRIIQIAPNDVEARQWRSLMFTLTGNKAEAVTEKKQIVRILLQARDLDNAIAELHQIIGLNQSDTEAYYMLGDVLMRRGEYGQAAQLYGRMLRMEGVEVERVEALQAAAQQMYKQHQARSVSS